ncbi:hypothetical protein B0H16DRAFT_1461129 [Mycena metata]|uniref:Uncharacterized protein n=1 Tax=Mycena metata TaxID=1033252 RepID=A0AAD7N918_9AGAR|nr:hypothetical protein B0H16DRAFT_1461129 [Mycena metata]
MRLLRNLYAGKSVWVENTNMDATWIHGLVEEVNPLQDGYQDVISDLIHFLWYFRPKYGQATLVSLQHILGVITSFDNTQRARHLAVMILCSSKNWFLSPITGPMLEAQSHQIWSVLISYRYCITLGAKLSHLPQWKLVISEDLPGCLDLYDQSQLFGSDLQSFKLLLFHVWEVDDGAFGGFGDEEVNAIRFTLLVKEWNQINVFTVRRQANLKLLRCTVRVMFSIRLEQFNLHQPSQSFKDTIMPPLGAALRAAGARLNAAVEFEGSTDQKQMDALNFMADILLKLGSFTEGELRNGTNLTKREREHWIGLKDSFLVDIKKLGEMWGEGPEED